MNEERGGRAAFYEVAEINGRINIQGERIAGHEARILGLESEDKRHVEHLLRIEKKIDDQQKFVIGTMVTAIGSLLMLVYGHLVHLPTP